jgi:hypothetical protein
MSCGTVSGFETPLVRAYAVGEGVTRERESVNEAATSIDVLHVYTVYTATSRAGVCT